MKKRSYSGLASDLRCANAEAQGYLDSLKILRGENERLTKAAAKWEEQARGADRLSTLLIHAIEFYQKAQGVR